MQTFYRVRQAPGADFFEADAEDYFDVFHTLETALTKAQKEAMDDQEDQVVFQAIKVVRYPVPQFPVEDVTS